MRKKYCLLILTFMLLTRCSEKKECCVQPEQSTVTLNFTHHWNELQITPQDFNEIKFTNENGEQLSIEKLRYLISNISLLDAKNHHLIDVGENTGTSISIPNLTEGSYTLSFRFGFSNEDNTDGTYQDLNSASFSVPEMLGGGYHFMQFDGKYIDNNNEASGFNYHTIRAVDRTDSDNLKFEDTSFEVNLGTIVVANTTEIEIKMNLAEWFKNPNTWNLNELNTVLMPNFEAQKMMRENGETVFSLGVVN
ncbi:MbnP family protein [uncultured Polaribacter sp.]|uniref:MbnP family protein n=1 Tax=uncultured Polaribacter sp. TaxID=174711 RepID=UPI00370406E3